MEMNEELVKLITRQVMMALENENASDSGRSAGVTAAPDAPLHGGRLVIEEKGDAPSGQYSDEVVVGLAHAFGTRQTDTINGLKEKGFDGYLTAEVASGAPGMTDEQYLKFIADEEAEIIGYLN